jgi:hypothetical protein
LNRGSRSVCLCSSRFSSASRAMREAERRWRWGNVRSSGEGDRDDGGLRESGVVGRRSYFDIVDGRWSLSVLPWALLGEINICSETGLFSPFLLVHRMPQTCRAEKLLNNKIQRQKQLPLNSPKNSALAHVLIRPTPVKLFLCVYSSSVSNQAPACVN